MQPTKESNKRGTVPSSKQRLLNFLRHNVGKVLTSRQLQRASGGAVEFGRRLRELREEGWPVETHRDDTTLRPGQWILRSVKKREHVKFAGTVSREIRARVLERNGYTCQMCGIAAGDLHPHDGCRATLHMAHILDKSKGGKPVMENLKAFCSVCNEGAQNIQPVPPTTRDVLATIRRADLGAQKRAYAWLRNKFGHDA